MGPFPDQEWAWGIFDLETRIPVLYHCLEKSHDYIVNLIKKHIVPGVILYSDQHASYVKLRASCSKLSQYGIYHFWVNHSHGMVNEKFTFVNTTGIEYIWCQLKKITNARFIKK